MMDRMSAIEFDGWAAYFAVEPFGAERADLRAGIVAATVANANRDPKKRREPFQPSDFMPFHEKGDPTDDQLAAKLRALGAPV